MKKILALLMSLAMMVTFMPTIAFADEGGPVVARSVDLAVGTEGNFNDVTIAPGQETTLQAVLFSTDDEPITDDVTFTLEEVENNVWDDTPDEVEPIVSISPEVGSENTGAWTVTAISDVSDGTYKCGFAIYKVKAEYNGQEYESGDRGIKVGWDISYDSESGARVYVNEEGKHASDFFLADYAGCSSDEKIFNLIPFYSPEDGTVTQYEYEVGHYTNDEEFIPFVHEGGYSFEEGVHLSKQYIKDILVNNDPSFFIRVTAKDEDENICTYDEVVVNVDDGKISLNGNFDAVYPNAVKCDGNINYDIAGDFHLYSKEEEPVELIAGDNTFRWIFLDCEPELITGPEDEAKHNILNEDGTLKLDHFGTYTAVARAIEDSDYGDFSIMIFELTDADNFYVTKPAAISHLQYTGEAIELVTPGETENKDDILYKVEGLGDTDYTQSYSTDMPVATEPGTYKVSYKVVDEGTPSNSIAEESVNVRIYKRTVDGHINNYEKFYGEGDGELKWIPEDEDNVPDEFGANISREAGEDVGEYVISAHPWDDEHYIANISSGTLTINPVDYFFHVDENITIGKNAEPVELEFDTDADPAELSIECEGDSIDVSDADKGEFKLGITPKALGTSTIKISYHDEDGNHNDLYKEIIVNVTDSIDETDGVSVDAANEDTSTKLNNSKLSVEEDEEADGAFDEIKGEGIGTSAPMAIELTQDTEPVAYEDGTEIVVKIKIDSENNDLINGIHPRAYYLEVIEESEEESNEPEENQIKPLTDNEEEPEVEEPEIEVKSVDNVWYENDGDDTYICFKTSHLSTWMLAADAAFGFEDCHFNFEDNAEFAYTGNNLSLKLYKEDGENEELVDLDSYKITLEKEDAEEGYKAVEEARDEGHYKVTAEPIKNREYEGAPISAEFSIVTEPELTHSFTVVKYDEENHWMACDCTTCEDEHCTEISDVEPHEFKQTVNEKYLASPATCTEPAKYFYSCKCGAISENTFESGKALGHEGMKLIPKDEETGMRAHYYCTRCHKYFKDKDGKYEYNNAELYIREGEEPIDIAKTIISAGAVTYTGKALSASVTVSYDGRVLVNGVDYKIAKYSDNVNVGTGYVVITGMEAYGGSKTVGFNINPKGATIKSAKKAKKAFTARWKKQSKKMKKARITGYQVRYATKSDFSNAKIKTVKGYKKTSKKITKLKKKTKYYVQVRTYKKTGGKTYYSAWSKTKTVKTK